jgi:amidohydrolase
MPSSLIPEITSVRRHLHQNPELGYEESQTAALVTEHLEASGIRFESGVGKTGVVAYLPATETTERTIALRADMDALPIQEQTGLPYASQTAGKMHACGHDGHTAILLGAAKTLSALPNRKNNVLFLFQPAEEGGAGGKALVDAGVLKGQVIGKPAQVIFGLHGHPDHQVGTVATRVGPLMASAAQFRITVRGKGAHAAYPHGGIDPIVVAAHLVTALQTVASRNVDPLDSVVVTIGQMIAGVAHNVIPETADLNGTLRTLNQETESIARGRIESIVRQLPTAFGASAELVWTENPYPVTFNDPDATEIFRRVARNCIGESKVHEELHPSMGGEDFSYYGYQIPACFFFLGLLPNGSTEYPNLHSPFFDFNDDAIEPGIQLMTDLALYA